MVVALILNGRKNNLCQQVQSNKNDYRGKEGDKVSHAKKVTWPMSTFPLRDIRLTAQPLLGPIVTTTGRYLPSAGDLLSATLTMKWTCSNRVTTGAVKLLQ